MGIVALGGPENVKLQRSRTVVPTLGRFPPTTRFVPAVSRPSEMRAAAVGQ